MRPVAKQFGDDRRVHLVVASVDVGALSEAAAIHHQQPVMPGQSTLRLEASRAPRHGAVNQYHSSSFLTDTVCVPQIITTSSPWHRSSLWRRCQRRYSMVCMCFNRATISVLDEPPGDAAP